MYQHLPRYVSLVLRSKGQPRTDEKFVVYNDVRIGYRKIGFPTAWIAEFRKQHLDILFRIRHTRP